jgi:hypothetical protein
MPGIPWPLCKKLHRQSGQSWHALAAPTSGSQYQVYPGHFARNFTVRVRRVGIHAVCKEKIKERGGGREDVSAGAIKLGASAALVISVFSILR